MINSVIYTRIPLSDRTLVAEAATYGIPDLHEALGVAGGRTGLMGPQMRPLNAGLRIAGPAVTVYCYPGDNLMMHKALHLAESGQVVVVTNGGGVQGALWGDLAAIYARNKGLAGAIIEGNIRDSEALMQLRDPLWFTGIWAGHPEKKGNVGAINVPIVCAGTLVNPGDIVVADGDGVLVIPRRHLRMAVEGARARQERDIETRKRLASGGALHDLAGIDDVLKTVGVVVRETTWLDDEIANHHQDT